LDKIYLGVANLIIHQGLVEGDVQDPDEFTLTLCWWFEVGDRKSPELSVDNNSSPHLKSKGVSRYSAEQNGS
jgi:hypothetical protein